MWLLCGLQDLALYRKYREKEVASAARSLISLFRELAPGMLEKKDRGRGADISTAVKAYGASHAVDRIPGADLLQAELLQGRADHDGAGVFSTDDDEILVGYGSDKADVPGHAAMVTGNAPAVSDSDVDAHSAGDDEAPASVADADSGSDSADEGQAPEEFDAPASAAEDQPAESADIQQARQRQDGAASTRLKRKQPQQEDSLLALRKRLASSCEVQHRKQQTALSSPVRQHHTQASAQPQSDPDSTAPVEHERFLTEEDFLRIRELRQKQLVDAAMTKHGLKSAAKRAKLLAAAQDEADATLEAMVSDYCFHCL